LKENSRIVKRSFDKYLQKKGFAGDLQINHEESKLHINCQTDNSDERTQCNDVRQLSGGERSFTTLSLLMALGHVVRYTIKYSAFLPHLSNNLCIDGVSISSDG
jgi:chromosome segregation ATPase